MTRIPLSPSSVIDFDETEMSLVPVRFLDLVKGQEVWDKVTVEDWVSNTFSEKYVGTNEATQSDEGHLEPLNVESLAFSKPMGDIDSYFNGSENLEAKMTKGHTFEGFHGFDEFLGTYIS